MTLVTLIVLISLLLLLILLGLIESKIHYAAISKIPTRVHVNGTRGKSSVTRLIAAGLREGGVKTIAKTTGSSPRFIDKDGNDHVIQRFRPASIGEQIRMISRFSKEKPQAVVVECMAVLPQYQWIAEHRIIKSNYSVITNVKADHLEEMGYSLDQIGSSLSNTVPFNEKLFTSETKTLAPIVSKANKNNTSLSICQSSNIDKSYFEGFPYIEHPDNIALALKVCKEIGVPEKVAISGMRKSNPDPGSLTITKIMIRESIFDFVNAFAANDPQSTLKTLKIIDDYYEKKKKTVIFLNTRSDRQLRTQQLLDMIFKSVSPEHLIVRGENVENDIELRSKKIQEIPYTVFNENDSYDYINKTFSAFNDHVIIGIGNIVGWGELFVNQLKGYKSD